MAYNIVKYQNIFGEGWEAKLRPFLQSPEFDKIGKTIMDEFNSGSTIYPVFDKIFRAFKECPWERTKVVFLAANPYQKDNDGLLFSAAKSPYFDSMPQILHKLYDGIEKGTGKMNLERPSDLTPWANQGILLLNLDLTVKAGKRGAHIELWKPFIQWVFRALWEYHTGIIFVLIGKDAHPYVKWINKKANDYYVMEHPAQAVAEKRDWKIITSFHGQDKGIFDTINRVSKFLHNETIKWVE